MHYSPRITPILLLVFVLAGTGHLFGQANQANMDESKVPPYTLPDPLQMRSGKKIATAIQWNNLQRNYIYHLFQENVYGKYPFKKVPVYYTVEKVDSNALGGKAIRKMVRIYFTEKKEAESSIALLIYLPKKQKKRTPVFLGMNFYGNQSVTTELDIPYSKKYRIDGKGIVNHQATDSSKGSQANQWQVKEILARGYGLVTYFCGDVEEDYPDGWKKGLRSRLKDALEIQPEEWGALGVWAWSLSRVMDYLVIDSAIDTRKVALIGHSRLGKAALWAGASDRRFSIVISNESGEGGAALSKRWYGETVAMINHNFPHWFCANYKKYNDHTDALPLDQHMLLSLIAPRPLYIASAAGDQWSDPKGEFLSAVNADPIYTLLGQKGLGTTTMPALNHPVGNKIRYHIREGKHDVLLYDWQQFLQFADDFWGK